MRSHTIRGEEICSPMKTLSPVLPIIRNHHERWDGTGYPDGIKGEEIPLLARILQISDIYDALTTARPYKPALSVEEAMRILDDEARRGWRDPELVSLFQQCCPKIELRDRQSEEGSIKTAEFQQSLENMHRNLLK